MTIRKPAANASSALRGRPAFLQGKIPGATSPKGPAVQARAIFGGVAPAPPVLRPRCASRPGQIANPMMDKTLPWPRLLRSVRKPAAQPPRRCCAGPFSPQHRKPGVRSPRPQPHGGEGMVVGLPKPTQYPRSIPPWWETSARSPEQCSSADSISNTAA